LFRVVLQLIKILICGRLPFVRTMILNVYSKAFTAKTGIGNTLSLLYLA